MSKQKRNLLARGGETGRMLNLMRCLGTSLGVAPSMLPWRFRALTHEPSSALIFKDRPLLGAVEASFTLLILFTVIASLISLVRAPSRSSTI